MRRSFRRQTAGLRDDLESHQLIARAPGNVVKTHDIVKNVQLPDDGAYAPFSAACRRGVRATRSEAMVTRHPVRSIMACLSRPSPSLSLFGPFPDLVGR